MDEETTTGADVAADAPTTDAPAAPTEETTAPDAPAAPAEETPAAE